MNITIIPHKLSGTITPPPSKSQAHRLVIAAALGEGESTIENISLSQDIAATLRCVEALGASWEQAAPGTIRIRGIGRHWTGELPNLDCGESGSTLRFLIPVALAVAGGGVFTGHGRLMERPQGPYEALFREKGIAWEQREGVLTVRGRLLPGIYALPGNVSSQFFSGLLFALPLLAGDSRIVSTTPLESAGYIHMTRHAMEAFGVRTGYTIEKELPEEGEAFTVPGGQQYQAGQAAVEADWSQAAFWYAAAGLGSQVAVTGMNDHSLQMDRMILRYGDMIQGKPLHDAVTVPILGKTGTARGERSIQGGHSVGIDLAHCPDLAPPLAAWGAVMHGTLHLRNAGRLRLKESDRLKTVRQTLEAFGVQVEEGADSLTIYGRQTLRGGCTIDCCNDHRIAMMAAVLATRADAPVTLLGAECVAKSYPDFWQDYQRLGGIIQ